MKKLVGCLVGGIVLFVFGVGGLVLLLMVVGSGVSTPTTVSTSAPIPAAPIATPPYPTAVSPETNSTPQSEPPIATPRNDSATVSPKTDTQPVIPREPIASTSPLKTPTNPAPPAKKKTYTFGESVDAGDFTYAAYRYLWSSRLTGSKYLDKRPDAMWLFLEVGVCNNGKTAATVPTFEIRDRSGRSYAPSDYSWLIPDSIGRLDSLNPRVTKQGFIVFDMPIGSEYELIVSSGGFLAEKESISLGSLNPSVEFMRMQEAMKEAQDEKKRVAAETRRARAAEKAAAMPIREWASKDGKFTTKAKFIGKAGNKLTIEKEDGKQVTIDIEKLCDEDHAYVKSL